MLYERMMKPILDIATPPPSGGFAAACERGGLQRAELTRYGTLLSAEPFEELRGDSSAAELARSWRPGSGSTWGQDT